MKFLKNSTHIPTQPYSIPTIEKYIHDTKDNIDRELLHLYKTEKHNLSTNEFRSLRTLSKKRSIIIKPADKNLGIVILNTNDYITQCLKHLSTTTYEMSESFPTNNLLKTLENIISTRKPEITRHNQRLYTFLLPNKEHRTPKFYGLPKIHKPPNANGIPPVRPIVSHTNSLLSNSAKFLDHCLQPLARFYPDYIQNSTDLIMKLSTLYIKEEVTLVSMDVINLYPSIPQEECLEIIYNEMCQHQDLLIFSPGLLIQLLEFNMQNNFFEFAGFYFHQTIGVTMGASFAPTVANIFMSVLIQKLQDVRQHTTSNQKSITPTQNIPTNHPDFGTTHTTKINLHNQHDATNQNALPVTTTTPTDTTSTREKYRIRQSFSCDSQNVIYLITCKKCKKQYVGYTTKTLRERTNHHRSSIFTNQNRYISIHFNFPDHTIEHLSIQAIDKAQPIQLPQLEKFWINKLQTIKPKGLNYTDTL